MTVALVSYECPPETGGGGGIGTYALNAARMLSGRGHHVEVFAGGEEPSTETTASGARIHRIDCLDREAFPEAVVPRFAERHAAAGFDVVEGPEYYAEARGIREAFPDLPLVVKLHTPRCVLREVNVTRHLTWWDKARYLVGGLVRGQVPSPYWTYDPEADPERRHALEADLVAAPSRSIRDRMVERWGLDTSKVVHCPNAFDGKDAFLKLDPDTDTQRVTFIGKLEIRKGVLDLMQAIPQVLEQRPDASFRMIGRSSSHPRTREDLRTVMERRLRPYEEAVEFTGQVPYEQIPAYLEHTDICVFPSLWENFPNVCMEAMTAARGVVASRAGGMSEMLDGEKCGRLVEPEDPSGIAEAILDLLQHPGERKRLGRAARERVRTKYSLEAVGPRHENLYRLAIERHENCGA